ncbi:MAG: glycerophosphodiester phosphodiesterase [Pyrinomonadaceae bacterium]|nr:glycerophosphodiester phosphodiesterase [Pyrinomonadaceae bacterium]
MRSKWLKILLGCVVAVVAVYSLSVMSARPISDHPFFESTSRPVVIAHRGGAGLRPENTLPAFRHAVALGVDVLEMDVRSTSDGVLVLMHDQTVDRTTDGTGLVNSFTLEELRRLDAGYHWSPDGGRTFPFRGQGIIMPTLEEVFTAFPAMRMNIEMKQTEPSLVKPLCRMIRDFKMPNKVLIASFREEALAEFRHECGEVATSASSNEVRTLLTLNAVSLAAGYSPAAQAVQVPEYGGGLHVLTRSFIDAAHNRNQQVHAWTINETADMQRIAAMGVDGIITDYPDRLLKLLGRK